MQFDALVDCMGGHYARGFHRALGILTTPVYSLAQRPSANQTSQPTNTKTPALRDRTAWLNAHMPRAPARAADIPVVWNHRTMALRQLFSACLALRRMGAGAKVLFFCKMGEKRSLSTMACCASQVMGMHHAAVLAQAAAVRPLANLDGGERDLVKQRCAFLHDSFEETTLMGGSRLGQCVMHRAAKNI